MRLYAAPDLSDAVDALPSDIMWLHSAPLSGAVTHPQLFDFAESFLCNAPSVLAESMRKSLAPRWEELCALKLLGHSGLSRAYPDDVPEQEDNAEQNFLVLALAKCLASLGPGYGIVVRQPQYYDRFSKNLFWQLIQMASKKSLLSIAIEAPSNLSRDGSLADLLKSASPVRVKKKTRKHIAVSDNSSGSELLAVCPQGIPLGVYTAAGYKSLPRDAQTCTGPGNEVWAYYAPFKRRLIYQQLSLARKRQLCRLAFESWDPTGWGYIRRGWFAGASGDLDTLLVQHGPYVRGLARLGWDFLYRHFRAIGEHGSGAIAVGAWVCAGRLASRATEVGGRYAASRHYARALRHATDSERRAYITCELANLYAVQRSSNSLRRAFNLCQTGLDQLKDMRNAEARYRAEIRLKNIKALLAYHARDNMGALELETEALSLAHSIGNDYPAVRDWAEIFLTRNLAKLYEKRFDDLSNAIECLRKIVDAQRNDTNDILTLGRLLLLTGKFEQAANLIEKALGEDAPAFVSERQEFHGKVLLLLAHALCEQKIRSLSAINDIKSRWHDKLPEWFTATLEKIERQWLIS